VVTTRGTIVRAAAIVAAIGVAGPVRADWSLGEAEKQESSGTTTGPKTGAPNEAPRATPSETPGETTSVAPSTVQAKAHRPASNEPRLHHAAASVAAAHQSLSLYARIDHPELVKSAILVYRTEQRPALEEEKFRRAPSSAYVAQVPAEAVKPGWIEYAIELEALDGSRTQVLGTREAMHRVQVRDDLADERARALDARHGGRRSVFFSSAEYVDFGTSVAETTDATGAVRTLAVEDRYFRVEAGYTYRPLRFVSEFSLRGGVVRGQSPVPLGGPPAPGQSAADRFKVGLNYGAPTVRLRLHDIVHADAEFLTSVTEVGFSIGAGAALLVGDPYGSKLTLGVEGIEVFGVRFFNRIDIVATPSLTVAPIVEVTNMPHADRYGMRLLGEVDWAMGEGFSAAVRGGYQARLFTAGGPSAGVTLRYAF
jgi:hypothetical protein